MEPAAWMSKGATDQMISIRDETDIEAIFRVAIS